MTDTMGRFFDGLGRRGFEPILADITATARFDIADDDGVDTWRVMIDKGHLAAAHGGMDADCVMSADRTIFDGIVDGRVNPLAALLRGELDVSGDPELLVACQRLFLQSATPQRS